LSKRRENVLGGGSKWQQENKRRKKECFRGATEARATVYLQRYFRGTDMFPHAKEGADVKRR